MATARLEIVLTQVSQSVVNNTSQVTASLYYYGNGGSFNQNVPPHPEAPYGTLIINGVSYPFYATFGRSTSAQLLKTMTVTVPHNVDGTKTLTASASFTTFVSLGTMTASATKTLTTIPRASSIVASSTSVEYGSTIDFTITRASNSFTHRLLAGVSGTHPFEEIATNVGTSASWTLPVLWASYMPNNEQFIIRCETYSGSTLIGAKDILLTPVPTTSNPDMSPVVTIAVDDPTGNEATYGAYVQLQSKIHAVATETFYAGTTAKSRALTLDGLTHNSAEATSEVITSDTQVVTYKVTDGRGLTATASETLTVLPWHAPTLDAVSINRCKSDGTLDDEGAYVKVEFTYDISTLDNQNSKVAKVEYKKHSDTSYQTETKTLASYQGTDSIIVPASADYTFDIVLTLTDDFASSSASDDVGTGYVLVDYHNSGKGIAFGKVAEAQDLFDSNIYAQFREGLMVGNDIDANELEIGNFTSQFVADWKSTLGVALPTLQGILEKLGATYIIEEGTSGNWYYRKWSSGKVELYGKFEQRNVTAYDTAHFVIGSSTVTAYPFAITNPIVQATCRRIQSGGGFITYDYERTDYWSGIASAWSSMPTGTVADISWYLYVIADLQQSNSLLSAGRPNHVIELPSGELYDISKGEKVK